MKRSFIVALSVAGCFSDAPPATSDDTSDGSGTADSSASSSSGSDSDGISSLTEVDADTTTMISDADATGAPVCGNGVTEDEEECDDENLEDHDGCTITCELGPRIVTMYEVPSPDTVIGEDPMGATPYDESCYEPVDGEPRLIRRLYGRVGGSKLDTWTVSIGADCDRLELDWQDNGPRLVVDDTGDSLPELGDHQGLFGDWEVECPPDTVPIGVVGRTFAGNDPDNIVGLSLRCAPLTIEAGVEGGVVIGEGELTAWEPDGDGEAGDMDLPCPEGAVLVGFRAFADQKQAALYRLGINCAVPVVTFGPAD